MTQRQTLLRRTRGAKVAKELHQLCDVLMSNDIEECDGSGDLKTSASEASSSPVTVLCRFRGQSEAERKNDGFDAWELGDCSVTGKAGKSSSVPHFAFDKVFSPESQQGHVYASVSPLVTDFLSGVNCAVLCYGQTSAGKTHTLIGPPDDQWSDREAGLIPRMFREIFDICPPGAQLHLSMLEIYQERLRDLLHPDCKAHLRVMEGRSGEVVVHGLNEIEAASCEDALSLFLEGSQRRTTAATGMNDTSSRSHCICILRLKKESGAVSKLCFVDLAGSESVKKASFGSDLASGCATAVNSELSEESKYINKSLSNLGLVLNRLVEQNKFHSRGRGLERQRSRASLSSVMSTSTDSLLQEPHVPYRSSKLTRVLQDVLSGNTRITLIINCSMSSLQAAESLSTLRFGQRARSLVTSIKSNSLDANDDDLMGRTLQAARLEIQRLRLANEPSCTPRMSRSLTESTEDRMHPESFNLDAVGDPSTEKATSSSILSDSQFALRLSLSGPRLPQSAKGQHFTWSDFSPLSSPRTPPSRTEGRQLRCGAAYAEQQVHCTRLPTMSADQLFLWQSKKCAEVNLMAWEYPLTKKDLLLRALLAHEQHSHTIHHRLRSAEAELDWLQYLSPGAKASSDEGEELNLSCTKTSELDLTPVLPEEADASSEQPLDDDSWVQMLQFSDTAWRDDNQIEEPAPTCYGLESLDDAVAFGDTHRRGTLGCTTDMPAGDVTLEPSVLLAQTGGDGGGLKTCMTMSRGPARVRSVFCSSVVFAAFALLCSCILTTFPAHATQVYIS